MRRTPANDRPGAHQIFFRGSAKILALLSADVRSIVARRIATTEMADEQAIRDVEELLAVRLAALPCGPLRLDRRRRGLGEILQSLDREREHEIITGLAHDEPHLAEAVASHAFAIEDLLDWSRASAQILLAHVETAPLAVPLKATTAEVRHKILDLLPGNLPSGCGMPWPIWASCRGRSPNNRGTRSPARCDDCKAKARFASSPCRRADSSLSSNGLLSRATACEDSAVPEMQFGA